MNTTSSVHPPPAAVGAARTTVAAGVSSSSDDGVTTTFSARRVTQPGRRASFDIHLKAVWRHAARSFDLFVITPDASSTAGDRDGEQPTSWEAFDVKQPVGFEKPNWYERAVAALTDVDAASRFTFSFTEEDDDDGEHVDTWALKWMWHERLAASSSLSTSDPLLAPPLPLDAPAGHRLRGKAMLRRRRGAAAESTRRLFSVEMMERNEALRRENMALTRDIADLRRAVDFAHDELRAAAEERERAERDTFSRVAVLMNEKKMKIRQLEDELEVAARVAARFGLRKTGGGGDDDGDGSVSESDDDDDDNGLGGMDTDDEEKEMMKKRKLLKQERRARGKTAAATTVGRSGSAGHQDLQQAAGVVNRPGGTASRAAGKKGTDSAAAASSKDDDDDDDDDALERHRQIDPISGSIDESLPSALPSLVEPCPIIDEIVNAPPTQLQTQVSGVSLGAMGATAISTPPVDENPLLTQMLSHMFGAAPPPAPPPGIEPSTTSGGATQQEELPGSQMLATQTNLDSSQMTLGTQEGTQGGVGPGGQRRKRLRGGKQRVADDLAVFEVGI